MSPSSLKRKRDPSPQPVEDTPVFSHAAKRKKKKALLKVSKEEQKEKGDASTPVVKRQNSIWVGNLSFKTTQDSLRRFFDGVGEITRVHLPTKPGTGQSAKRENRGYGSHLLHSHS